MHYEIRVWTTWGHQMWYVEVFEGLKSYINFSFNQVVAISREELEWNSTYSTKGFWMQGELSYPPSSITSYVRVFKEPRSTSEVPHKFVLSTVANIGLIDNNHIVLVL
jgi:hypothetical protein